jgi:hypothetical protein
LQACRTSGVRYPPYSLSSSNFLSQFDLLETGVMHRWLWLDLLICYCMRHTVMCSGGLLGCFVAVLLSA